MAANESGERSAVGTRDRILQTVGGILLTACTIGVGWTINQIYSHEGRIKTIEERTENQQKGAEKLEAKIDNLRNELGAKVDRVWDELRRRP